MLGPLRCGGMVVERRPAATGGGRHFNDFRRAAARSPARQFLPADQPLRLGHTGGGAVNSNADRTRRSG
jgi:hypothetical protein